jgi:hypothetical protein
MRKLQLCGVAAVLAAIPPVLGGCGDDDDTPPIGQAGGTAGTGGTGGTGGTEAGTGGGGTGGSGGSAGTAGTAGTGGSAGDGGIVGCGPRPSGDPTPLGATIAVDMTLDPLKVYSLNTAGTFVNAPATLTIPPCTTILGGPQSALIITRGAKIMAVGEKDKPIVFTSIAAVGQRAPGDWGGIVMLGRAQVNQPGGEAAIEGIDPNATGGRYGPGTAAAVNDDNSGTLKYVRIEFAGFKFGSNNELNGLTMGGVGSGTTIDYVMVHQPLDDGFEWFGGTVNASHLVVNDTAPAPGGGDDIYDCDFGFVGKVTNFFARKSRVSSNDPNGFEWDNSAKGEDYTPKTNPTFEKGTLCGTDLTAASGGSYGAVFRRRTNGTINQIVWSGWKFAFDIRDADVTPNPTAITVTNSIVASGTEVANAASTPAFDEAMWFSMGAGNQSNVDPGFSAADCFAAPGSAEFKKVMDSNKGAFQDDKTWMEGAWLDWSDN